MTTETDCVNFCNAACLVDGRVDLVSGDGKYRVNAKSILGCLMASADWGNSIFLETDEDLYGVFNTWIADAVDDNISIHE